MRTRVGLILAAAIAAALPSTSLAGERATLSLGAGASGTSNSAFRGGWGATMSLEMPMNASASFLVRADYHAVPEEAGEFRSIVPWAAAQTSWFGSWPDGAQRVSAAALLAGMRFQAPPKRLQTYLDALVGIGHARYGSSPLASPAFIPEPDRPQSQNETNVALSFGAGMKLRAIGEGSVFLDAHYDFYFVSSRQGAIVPIRLGYGIPLGKRSV